MALPGGIRPSSRPSGADCRRLRTELLEFACAPHLLSDPPYPIVQIMSKFPLDLAVLDEADFGVSARLKPKDFLRRRVIGSLVALGADAPRELRGVDCAV